MFGPLGLPELIFIFVLALLIFGPKRLPEVGRTVGKGLAEFRKASTDLRRTINAELIDEEIRAADPRKIVRDSLRDVKKGLELDPKAESAKSEGSSGPESDQASPAESSAPQADVGGSIDPDSEPSTPQTPLDTEPDRDEPSALEPAGVVARGSVTGSRVKRSSTSEAPSPSEAGAAGAPTTDNEGVEEAGKDTEGTP